MNTEKLDRPADLENARKFTLGELFQISDPFFAAKLPEWNGFWFKAKGNVYVFTKDNAILNTPFYEEYGNRGDWEQVELSIELAERFLKANRIRIDEIMQKANQYLPYNRETSLVKTSLQTAFMWIGLELGALGTANPYPKSMDASSPVIEKHTDLKESDEPGLIEALGGLDETGMVKALRLEIQHSIDILRWYSAYCILPRDVQTGSYPNMFAVDKSLVEAKLWLGQQLNNIRIQSESGISQQA